MPMLKIEMPCILINWYLSRLGKVPLGAVLPPKNNGDGTDATSTYKSENEMFDIVGLHPGHFILHYVTVTGQDHDTLSHIS